MEHLLNIDIEEQLVPKFAIIGYEKCSNHYSHDHYFAYHKIVAEKLTAGMPLTKTTASNIFNCLESDLIKFSFKGIIPNNLIHFEQKGTLKLIWYSFPKQTYLYFENGTGITNGVYPIPRLVFVLKGTSLYVFAIKRKDKIEESTLLFNAPFLNVNREGKVCMGSANIDYEGFEFYEDIMSYVEKQFFNSVFTHTHNTKLVKGNIVEVMKKLLQKKRFEDELLITKEQTIKSII